MLRNLGWDVETAQDAGLTGKIDDTKGDYILKTTIGIDVCGRGDEGLLGIHGI